MANLVFFHAHPDDEAISTGGTMALASDQGHHVTLVVATRGEMGEPVEGVLNTGELLGRPSRGRTATVGRNSWRRHGRVSGLPGFRHGRRAVERRPHMFLAS